VVLLGLPTWRWDVTVGRRNGHGGAIVTASDVTFKLTSCEAALPKGAESNDRRAMGPCAAVGNKHEIRNCYKTERALLGAPFASDRRSCTS
jgi:hypothetical protein